MLPVLADLRIIKVYTFGVFLVLAFFWALFWLWRNIRRTSFKEEQIFDAVFISLIGGFIGARLMFVALHFNAFGFDPLKFILINGYPGMSMAGLLIGGLLTLAIVTKVNKLPYLEVVAYIIPSLFLGLGIGKLGSFFAGTVVGTPTNFVLHVAYVGHEGLRHITAVYEAICMFIGFVISQRLLMNYRRDAVHEGSLLSFFVVLTALSQIFLDNLKDNDVYLYGFRFGMLLSAILLAVFGLWEVIKYRSAIGKMLFSLIRRNKKHDSKKASHTRTG